MLVCLSLSYHRLGEQEMKIWETTALIIAGCGNNSFPKGCLEALLTPPRATGAGIAWQQGAALGS